MWNAGTRGIVVLSIERAVMGAVTFRDHYAPPALRSGQGAAVQLLITRRLRDSTAARASLVNRGASPITMLVVPRT